MSDTPKLIASASQTVGPFFHFGPGDHPQLGRMVTPGTLGERMTLTVRVFDGDGAPVPDALIEIWQADGHGRITTPAPGTPRDDAFGGFGRMPTSTEGAATFDTVKPGRRAEDDAPHVNLCVFMRGLMRHLYTRCYFSGESDLARDAVLALVPEDRRQTLMAYQDPEDAASWSFDVLLQGPRETVFFDL